MCTRLPAEASRSNSVLDCDFLSGAFREVFGSFLEGRLEAIVCLSHQEEVSQL